MLAFAGADADIFELVIAEFGQVPTATPVVPPLLDKSRHQLKKF